MLNVALSVPTWEYQSHVLGGVEVGDSEPDAQNAFSLSPPGLALPKFTVELNRNIVQMLEKRHLFLDSSFLSGCITLSA